MIVELILQSYGRIDANNINPNTLILNFKRQEEQYLLYSENKSSRIKIHLKINLTIMIYDYKITIFTHSKESNQPKTLKHKSSMIIMYSVPLFQFPSDTAIFHFLSH
jgi:hypothetical protein